jgi:hypothetical protein
VFAAKAIRAVFTVPNAERALVAVEARSEFEARIWAANKVENFYSLCRVRPGLVHLGPMCRCGHCYAHCRCEARP